VVLARVTRRASNNSGSSRKRCSVLHPPPLAIPQRDVGRYPFPIIIPAAGLTAEDISRIVVLPRRDFCSLQLGARNQQGGCNEFRESQSDSENAIDAAEGTPTASNA